MTRSGPLTKIHVQRGHLMEDAIAISRGAHRRVDEEDRSVRERGSYSRRSLTRSFVN